MTQSFVRRYRTGTAENSERGQVMIIFAAAFVVICMMLGLLFDGARGLTMRRQLQDTSDAAALSAVNLIQGITPHGCSATGGATPGAPQASVVAAAVASVAGNMPEYNANSSNVVVTCPSAAQLAALGITAGANNVVRVDLGRVAPTFFGSVLGSSGLQVNTTSMAINGKTSSNMYSVVELDPSGIGPSPKYNGCPSVLFSGSNTIIFDGSLEANSACTAGNGGALGTNGNSATVTFNNGATANLVGGYAPGPLLITPAPVTGVAPITDPLLKMAQNFPIPWTSASFPVRANTKTSLNGGSTVLEPGVYRGGIAMKNSAVAYLHPGIYVFVDDASGNGGFTIGSQNKVYSLPANLSSTTTTNWPTDCPVNSNCGVLLYNTGMVGNDINGPQKDAISVGAGATLQLRPYTSLADGTGVNQPAYDNLLFWQDKNPQPSSSYAQPAVSLSGGGTIDISGTVYAPSAVVQMGGNSGGSGGSSVNVTLQFISWDIQFNGNIGFHFFYQSDAFASNTAYGLVR
jgi:Flp pilus assembly protein TadG